MICRKNKVLIIARIEVLLNNKTINSKIEYNKLNFDANMKDFLSTLETEFNQYRLDFITINLMKSNTRINVKKGQINEFY